MTLLLILFITAYFLMLSLVADKFEKIEIPDNERITDSQTTFSIVIPYRNECDNLPVLIESLQNLNYPADQMEVIFSDDHSTDDGFIYLHNEIKNAKFNIVFAFNKSDEQGKKAALHNGIQKAKFEYIVTTDADCTLNPEWLNALDEMIIRTKAEMITGPVLYEGKNLNSLLTSYQFIENAGLICFTAFGFAISKPFMANGANLCFRKKSYFYVEGYEGNFKIPSGDDEFLLQKFKESFPGKNHFLKNKDATVTTHVQIGLPEFLDQRVRWASKSRKHKNKSTFILQTTIALFYFLMLLNLVIDPFPGNILPLLLKIAADFYFYSRIKNYFNLEIKYIAVVISSLLQIFFVPVIGFSALTGSYKWKDREYKI